MGHRLGSYDEMGGSSGKAEWLDSWKKDGFLKLVLHREPPWMRSVHNFRRIRTEEERSGVSKKIIWFPFVCWEDEDFHRRRRFEKENPPEAELCPGCRFEDHLESREDLADDDVIFRFEGSKRGDVREILKVDFLGHGQTRRGFQDNFLAKTDYIIPVIPLDVDPLGVYLTNERWSLGKSLNGRIKKDRKLYGDEDGDPSKTPIAYTFEYDEETQTYGVARLEGVDITDEIVALWEGPSPDAEKFVAPGNPKHLLESFEASLQIDDVPLEEIFAPAFEAWEDDDVDEKETSKPAKSKAPPTSTSKSKTSTSKSKSKTSTSKSKTSTSKSKTSTSKSKAAPKPKPEPEKKTRPTRSTKKPEPPPEEEDLGEVYKCPECGGDWPEKLTKCPNEGCDAVAADDDEEEEAPEEPKGKNGRARRGGDIPFDVGG